METLNAQIKATKLGFISNEICSFDLILDIQGEINELQGKTSTRVAYYPYTNSPKNV